MTIEVMIAIEDLRINYTARIISRFRPFWSRLGINFLGRSLKKRLCHFTHLQVAACSLHAGSDLCAKCYIFEFQAGQNDHPSRPCAEQLEKVEAGMDSINQDMQIAEKALKGMELCCGIFPKFWKK